MLRPRQQRTVFDASQISPMLQVGGLACAAIGGSGVVLFCYRYKYVVVDVDTTK